jgi:hypothetical protein
VFLSGVNAIDKSLDGFGLVAHRLEGGMQFKR